MRIRLNDIFVSLLKAFFCLAIALGMLGLGGQATAATLDGAIEFHVHSAPDVTARLYDDLELVDRAQKAGMQAIVLKNHVTPTADRAVLAHKVVPNIEVYGGVVLNEAVGGLNVKAVEVMEKLGAGRGKIVWLPTIDAAHHRQTLHQGSGGIKITKGDRLLPAVEALLKFMADKDLILGTGHISPAEILKVVPAAKKYGVTKILVTHAMATVPGLNLAQMQTLADQGAFLELTYVNTLMGDKAAETDHLAWDNISIATMATAIKTIGAEHFVLSTDLGRSLDPSPVEGYKAFLDELADADIAESDLYLMSHTNPLQLLQ